MVMIRSLPPLLLLLLLVGVSHASNELPEGIEGLWQGVPSTSIVGPWNQSFSFGIQPIADGSGHLIGDLFADRPSGSYIPSSFQRFWTNDTNLVYCGNLKSGYARPNNEHGSIVQVFERNHSASSATSAVFQGQFFGKNTIDITYTITMLNATTLHVVVLFGPAKHLDVTFTKVGDVQPYPGRWGVLDGSCDVITPVLTGQARPLTSASKCPMAHLHRSAHTHKAPHRSLAPPATSQTCYTLNPAMDFQLAWTVSPDQASATFIVSANVESSTAWIGVEFGAQFPLMMGGDVVLGFMTTSSVGCVEPKYVVESVGEPGPNDKLSLSDTSIKYSGGRLTMTFTRELGAGYVPLSTQPPSEPWPLDQHLYYATGPSASASSCDAFLPYHGDTRGVHMFSTLYPTQVFAEWQKC